MSKRVVGEVGKPIVALTASTKKRRTAVRNACTNARRILLSVDNFQRWVVVRDSNKLKNNGDVATFLLDSYEEQCALSGQGKPIAISTPMEEDCTKIRPKHLCASASSSNIDYEEQCALSSGQGKPIATSTPMEEDNTMRRPKHPCASASSSEIEIEAISGIDKLSNSSTIPVDSTSSGQSSDDGASKRKEEVNKSESYADISNITIEMNFSSESEQGSDDEEDDDDDDLDYEPSFDISLCPTEALNLEETSFAEEEFGCDMLPDHAIEEEINELEPSNQSEEEIDGSVYVKYIDVVEDAPQLIDDETCLVYLRCLKALAAMNINKNCSKPSCNGPVNLQTKFIGSAVHMKWDTNEDLVGLKDLCRKRIIDCIIPHSIRGSSSNLAVCVNSHLNARWCSQPILNQLHGGDLLLSTALLSSGNNYAKIALFAKFLKLHFVNMSTYYRIQRRYLAPAIEELWDTTQTETLKAHEGKEVVLLGDGRMDSPGHSAQYCTYTAMANSDKSILSILTIDKREAEGKSTQMEKLGFQNSLELLKKRNMKVVECVTDAHSQIGAMMKREYPDIKHSHDIWHAAKNLAKKLVAAGQKKDCKVLLSWSKDIVSHFWYTCEIANTYDEFIGVWCGILHHVTNEHEWALPYSDVGVAACNHGPMETVRDKDWMSKGGPAHDALRKIVLCKRFLNKIPYWLNFRGTAELENFHQCILMYAAKRFSYTPPIYKARNLLAALDYTTNHKRAVRKNKDGTTRYQRLFNKKSKRWTVVPVKEAKDYTHIENLKRIVVESRVLDQSSLKTTYGLAANDPRRTIRNIAPIPPPPTQQLVEEHISRVK